MSGTITSIRKPTSSTCTCRGCAPRSTRTSTSPCCIPCAGLATRSAMALADRLARAVSTTAFRMAAVTAAAYLAFAGVAVGLLLWQTNRVLTNEVLTTLHAEAEVLKAEAQAGDKAALVRAVEARSRPGGPGLYYLRDASGAKLAGQLSQLPPEIIGSAAGGVFGSLSCA